MIDPRGGSTRYEYDERTLQSDQLIDRHGWRTRHGPTMRAATAPTSAYPDGAKSTSTTTRSAAHAGRRRARRPLALDLRRGRRLVARSDALGHRHAVRLGEPRLVGVTDPAGQYTKLEYDARAT